MKLWSKHWKSSKQPKKQRKYRYNAPLHIKKKFLFVNLSKDLRKKYNRRNVKARKGDKVRILRGQFKKKEGIINRIFVKKTKVWIDGIQITKKDGSNVYYPFNLSNLQIIDLNLEDRGRRDKLEKKND